MQVSTITSLSNPLLKKVRSLRQRAFREKLGLFVMEGAKLIGEAYAGGIAVTDVIVSRSYFQEGLPHYITQTLRSATVVDDAIFKELSTTTTPCGILAVAHMLKESSLESCLASENPLLVICAAIQDPGNLGSILRAALAFGAGGAVITRGSVDPYNSKVIRSAMGALFSLPFFFDVEPEQAMDDMRKRGINILALSPYAQKPFWLADLKGPTALVFGNEGQGLTPGVLGLANQVLSIPMHDRIESLNVAVSAGIVLYECARQRYPG